MRSGCALVIATLCLCPTVRAESDWTRFRGPNGSGSADVSSLPDALEPAGALWSTEVLFGRSSPIVDRGLVFLTGLVEDELTTVAYRADDGAELWRRSLPRRHVGETFSETGPSAATPTSDGKRVFVFFPELGLVSYDREGNEVWRHELEPFRSYYGMASSPILVDGVVVLQCDQTHDPYILGVDADTGEELWRHPREIRAESWSTPIVYREGTPQALILTFGTFVVDAYRPGTGELAWRVPGMGPTPVSSPVLGGDRLFVVAPDQQEGTPIPSLDYFDGLDVDRSGGLSREELSATDWVATFPWLDLNADGAAAMSEIATQMELMRSPDFGLVAIDLAGDRPMLAWRQRKTLPYIASPIYHDGVLFTIKDGGILTSYDPASGDMLKRARIEGTVEPFFPSPVVADGKLYLASSLGSVAVVTAEAAWETLSVSDFDEQIFASPAVADDRLYLRTRSRLYAFGAR